MYDKKEKIKITVYSLFKCICKMFSYSFFRMRVQGLENVPKEGGFLLLCNHQSFLDPVLIGVPLSRRVHFVARDTLSKTSFGKIIMDCCMTIPIKRGQADTRAIKDILRTLKQGEGVGLFPEATRTSDGKIIDVKPGFGLLSRKSKVAIIPTVIEGAFEAWPRHRKIFLPGDIDIIYGQPISSDQAASMDDETFAKVLSQKLREMQNQCRIQTGKKPFDYSEVETQQKESQS